MYKTQHIPLIFSVKKFVAHLWYMININDMHNICIGHVLSNANFGNTGSKTSTYIEYAKGIDNIEQIKKNFGLNKSVFMNLSSLIFKYKDMCAFIVQLSINDPQLCFP